MPMDRLWRLIAQSRLLGGCYTRNVEKCYNPISYSRKPKTEFQYTGIGNTEIQIIAKCSRYCRLLLAAWNCVKQYICLTCFWHAASELGYSEEYVVCMPTVLIFDFVRRSLTA